MARALATRLERIHSDRLEHYRVRYPVMLPDPIADDLAHALGKLRATLEYQEYGEHVTGLMRLHKLPDGSTLLEEWHSDGWLELTARGAGRLDGLSFLLDATITG